jgi:hypothetical protein
MPIEIRELVVKATVRDRTSEQQAGSSERRREKEEIIRECVDQVMEILKRKKER